MDASGVVVKSCTKNVGKLLGKYTWWSIVFLYEYKQLFSGSTLRIFLEILDIVVFPILEKYLSGLKWAVFILFIAKKLVCVVR